MTAIIQDIVSIFFVLALGYFSGKKNAFTQDQAGALLKVVLNYCLPATLFVSIVRSTRAELFAEWNMLLSTFIVLIVSQLVVFLAAMYVFKHNHRESGIASLVAGAPTVGFLGIAVLSPIYGAEAGLTVAIVALIVNVIMVPIAIFLIAPEGQKPSAALVNAIKQPVVLSPLIAVVLVLLNVHVPGWFLPPLSLIAHANSGIAVFAAGLVLSAHKLTVNAEVLWNTLVKLVLAPAAMLMLALAFGISGAHLEQLVLLVALPTLFTGIVLSGRYQLYVELGSSTLITTTVLFAAAAPAWIAIVRAISH
jgi:malonate transporter